MNQKTTFIYKYSAKENREIEKIRCKYLPRKESKLEELKRLDNTVQNSGMIESLSAGIGGGLVFGLGLCLAMRVIGAGAVCMVLGVLLGLLGMTGMLAAYPVYRKISGRTKKKLTPRILELAAELAGEKA